MILFLPVYLWNKEDCGYRLNLAKRILELGYSKIGVQFLFINEDELKSMEELSKRALDFKRDIEKLFDEVRYAAHAPYLPYSRACLEFDNDAIEHVKKIAEFPIELDLINTHLSHPATSDWLKLKMSHEKKQLMIERIVDKLRELEDLSVSINIENLCLPAPDENHVTYLGGLPSDFVKIFSKIHKIGFTLDTCHSGILSKACSTMATKEDVVKVPGLFEEEFAEIQRVRREKDYVFLELAEKLTHMHISDFKGLEQGVVPGKGERSVEEIKEIVRRFAGKETSGLVEVYEQDYRDSPNTYETYKILRDI